MIDKIIEILKNSTADGWRISDEIKEGWEFYFIKHELDQNRVRHTEHTFVTVYKKIEDGKYLGSAQGEIVQGSTDEEIQNLINALVSEAVFVKNPVYELVQPSKETVSGDQHKINVSENAKNFIKAYDGVKESAEADLNSYEIFTDKVTKRIITSTGIDITTEYPVSMTEAVVNARNEEHEIELYRLYDSGSCDTQSLTQNLEETMKYGVDKLKATKTPNLGKYDVVFSTDAATQIYQYFGAHMLASAKYQKFSDWEIGQPVIKDAKGDLVSIKALKYLENSADNAAFDAEGSLRRDLEIITNGIAKNYYGSRQFAQYMGIGDSFIPANFQADGGTKTEEEIRSGQYIEIVEFSDFQVDSFSGDIFGEIRLGYLHDGDQVKVVEGGSVSGSMIEFAKNMTMSKNLKQYNTMLIPSLTRLAGVTIAGA